jgi:hypothetical protein
MLINTTKRLKFRFYTTFMDQLPRLTYYHHFELLKKIHEISHYRTQGAPSVSMTQTVNGKNLKLLKFVETILSTSLHLQTYFLTKCSNKGSGNRILLSFLTSSVAGTSSKFTAGVAETKSQERCDHTGAADTGSKFEEKNLYLWYSWRWWSMQNRG